MVPWLVEKLSIKNGSQEGDLSPVQHIHQEQDQNENQKSLHLPGT